MAEFASKGVAGTALGLGAGALGVELLRGGLGGLFGGMGVGCSEQMPVNRYEAAQSARIAELETEVKLRDANIYTDSKLNDLRKGTSTVLEQGHTTIVGFDNNIYSILSELIEANANKKDACIVVLGELPKIEMEEAISAHFPDTHSTRIICRSGGLHEMHSLALCSLETSRSVIVNISEDAQTVKTILAISAYLKGKTLAYPDLHIIAALQDSQFMEAARIAGEGRACIIYSKDAIARIISDLESGAIRL